MTEREIGSDARAVVEELTQTDGKDEIAENCVVETREKERAGVLVGEGKQEAPDDAQDHGEPIAKDYVHESESKGTGSNHQQATAKQRRITVKEEGAVDEFLGIDGNERVEEHDQGPEAGCALQEGKEQLGRKNADCETQKNEKDSIAHEKRQELGTNVVPRSEMRRIKAGVAAQNQESGKSGKQEVGDGEVGQKAIINKQRNADEERGELQRKQNEAQHRGAPTAYLRLRAACQP